MSTIGHAVVILALVLGLLLLIAVAVLALQIVAHALRPRPAETIASSSPRGSLAVLVPAHDEEGGIAATIATVRAQLAPGDRLLVVADNCSDGTAAAARAAGAEVIERTSNLRGKGYALSHGIDHLRANPPSAVVIVDADCVLSPGALAALLQDLAHTGRPVQALYLMLAAADAGLGRRLAQFAWRVRNWVRPAGWHRLGLPCQLMGTGMAFSWDMLKEARLANASIVEDMKLGIELATLGAAPVFCDRALVTSQFPDSAAATGTQRTRWEHGHIEMILHEVPPCFARRWPGVTCASWAWRSTSPCRRWRCWPVCWRSTASCRSWAGGWVAGALLWRWHRCCSARSSFRSCSHGRCVDAISCA
jgi:cellulose synthase/poly-beta-1,6-N-acetylglucosamine synthase-like glycosyltransferase